MDPLSSPVVEVFRRRWRRSMLATVLVVVAVAGAKADVPETYGIPLGQELLGAAALFAVWGLVFWTSWRCPACSRFPGHHWRPRYCDSCGTQLLPVKSAHPGGGSQPLPGTDADRVARTAWQGDMVRRERDYLQVSGVKYGMLLMVLAVCIFMFGIAFGVGGDANPHGDLGRRFGPDASRWAGMALGLLGTFFFPRVVRACRRAFEDSGMPPEGVDRIVSGMLFLAGAVMVFCGVGGLLYAFTPFESTPLGWELRLAPLDHARELAVASALYAGLGVLLLGRHLPRLRGRRSPGP